MFEVVSRGCRAPRSVQGDQRSAVLAQQKEPPPKEVALGILKRSLPRLAN